MDPDPVADDRFLACLTAIASPTRLSILRAIRVPRALREIEVRGGEEGEDRTRPLARQTVRRHLDVLLEAGMVETRDADRAYGDTTEFTLNHQRFFALAEDVRALARMRPVVEPAQATVPLAPAAAPPGEGPRLVVVHGLEEGATFPLMAADGKRAWIVGRRRDCDVPLDFDPSVSSQNAIVRAEGAGRVLEDVPGSRNGTTKNFRRLAAGELVPLAHGDLVGVGRSLLLYWT